MIEDKDFGCMTKNMSKESLASAFAVAQYTIETNLDGIDHEQGLECPSPGGNCLNWITGHILATRGILLTHLGEASFLAKKEAEPYDRGAPPLKPGKPCVNLDRLREGLRRTSENLQARLKSLDGAEFEEMLDPSVFPVPMDPPTRGALLTLFLFHEGYHCGQLGMGRRLAGKEGRIA